MTQAEKHLLQNPPALYHAKPAWWPYFCLCRLHKFPAGTTVFFAPCGKIPSQHLSKILTNLFSVWGLLMGAQSVKFHSVCDILAMATLWYFGNITGHAAACIWNDICDRDVDRLVGMLIYLDSFM